MRSIAVFIASLATAFAQAAAAQEIPARVGRIAHMEGPVSIYQDPELGWDKAYVNTPITSENSVWTDRGARAEVRIGGMAVRLDGETQLDVSRLDEDDFDAGVPRGAVNLRVRYKQRNDHVTLSTPHALFVIEGDGRYRLDVDEDRDQSRLTVFSGRAYAQGSSGNIPVESGRMLVIAGDGRYDYERAREDRFDRWAAARDQQWSDSRARNYVSYDMTGYEELDRYGNWSEDPDYGVVWYPTRVASDWAPYRYGHWSYVRPWGWTWVDDAPWGYAPSHYGRWVLVGNRWAWAPGYVRERPVWAPALVGFFGGAGFSIGVSSGAPVGWYPLAPWERYDPWYRTNTIYLNRVNRYVVDRRPRWWDGRGDEWRYWNRERAATVVNRDVFVNRRQVQNAIVRVNPEALRQAPVASNPQVVQQVLPQRNELLRYREANRTTVAAPVVRPVPQSIAPSQPGISAPAPQASAPAPQQGQVVRPEFRRRGEGPTFAAPVPSSQPGISAPAPSGQPGIAAPAPQQPNPMARPDRDQQQAQELQRRREEAAQRANEDTRRRQEAFQRQQQEQAQRQQQEQAQRQQQEQAQREQAQRAAEQQRQQQEQAQRAAREQERAQREAQRQQQEAAQRAAQEQQRAQQQQQQQANELLRRREEAAQRAAEDTRRRQEAFQRQQQEQAQRQQQEQAQRQQQEQAQRAAAEQQRRQQEQAQREAQRQQQEAQRQQQEAQRQQQQQQQAQPQREPAPQANPTARGENPTGRARGRDRDDKDKEKDKEKEKDRR